MDRGLFHYAISPPVIYLFIVNKKKRNIKSRKIDKRKRKILVFKHIITLIIFVNLSTITTIAFIPFDFGNGPIMSILISYHGPYSMLSG